MHSFTYHNEVLSAHHGFTATADEITPAINTLATVHHLQGMLYAYPQVLLLTGDGAVE